MLDLGAGGGAITLPPAATGARVLAVERDERLARRLARGFANDERVRVVTGDLERIPLPRRRYQVVATEANRSILHGSSPDPGRVEFSNTTLQIRSPYR